MILVVTQVQGDYQYGMTEDPSEKTSHSLTVSEMISRSYKATCQTGCERMLERPL